MIKRSFVLGILSTAAISCLGLLLPLYWIEYSPACEELAALVCSAFSFSFIYPIFIVGFLVIGTLLLSRYFLIPNAFLYVWTALMVPMGVMYGAISGRYTLTSPFIFFAAISLAAVLLISLLLRGLEKRVSKLIMITLGLVLPLLVFSPWIVRDIQKMRAGNRQAMIAEKEALKNIPFKPYIHPTMKAKLISAKTAAPDKFYNPDAEPYVSLEYDNFMVYEILNTKHSDAAELCRYNYASPDKEYDMLSICAEKGTVRGGSKLIYEASYYYVVLDNVAIIINPFSHTQSDSSIPDTGKVVEFINTLVRADPDSLTPTGYN